MMSIRESGAKTALEPDPEIVVGTCEQLLHLLAEAGEIEHTLMCSYLYAAFSLKRAGEPGVSEVAGWKRLNIGARHAANSAGTAKAHHLKGRELAA